MRCGTMSLINDNYTVNQSSHIESQGQARPQDYQKAMEWFLKAADQGHAGAQYHIGVMHLDGLGVPQDNSRAMSWMLRSRLLSKAAVESKGGRYIVENEPSPR